MGLFSEWFGDACSVCRASARGICTTCSAGLLPAEPPPLLGIARATVVCSYEGVGADLVRAIKFHNRRQSLGVLVDALSTSLTANEAARFDAVVAVPAHARRARERGFDVPELMAARLAKRLSIPRIEPLVRVDDGSQSGRSREQRRAVEFRARLMVPARILLVDDVVTTGATVVACASALGLAGAEHVEVVALAATPPGANHERSAKDLASSTRY